MLSRVKFLNFKNLLSLKNVKLFRYFLWPLILNSSFAQAQDAYIPEQELSRESVLPIFDVTNSVRNRNVVLKDKIELGIFGGATTDEAIYNGKHFGGIGSYHFDEIHSVNLMFGQYATGLSSYSDQLKNSKVNLDFGKTFAPKSYFLLNYQGMAYYGKFSILKNYNYNFHVFGIGGVGFINYDGAQELALNFGLGQRIYFTPNIAIKIEYRFIRFNGPNPVSISDKVKLSSGSLKIGDYSTATFFQNHITVGLVALF